ncbi:Odorant receptor coreceptor [Eumeta japonica]|uniref:Odorant receptor coreceptor n=1 Tax=Eumeta variegata TaxID=151549 RepID=A0A4C1YEY5_EUMVA|nr:Odorant receptor coreceptor [Eumeta japonica]
MMIANLMDLMFCSWLIYACEQLQHLKSIMTPLMEISASLDSYRPNTAELFRPASAGKACNNIDVSNRYRTPKQVFYELHAFVSMIHCEHGAVKASRNLDMFQTPWLWFSTVLCSAFTVKSRRILCPPYVTGRNDKISSEVYHSTDSVTSRRCEVVRLELTAAAGCVGPSRTVATSMGGR